jgi:cytochrome P450 family 135
VAATATAEPRAAKPQEAGAVGRGLPPSPRLPAPIQTLGVVARPVPFLEWCRRRYGETFTLRVLRAGELVFISDPPSLKRLFGADRRNTIAPGRNVVLRPILGDRSLLLQEGEEHLRRRKLMLPPFHGERMRAYEAVMSRATDREIDSWPVGSEFKLHPSMQAITLEVILSAVFGVEEGDRRDSLRANLIGILATTRSPAAIGMTIDRMRRLPRYRRVAEMIATADRILFEEIAERRADPHLSDREDILSMLVAARFEDDRADSGSVPGPSSHPFAVRGSLDDGSEMSDAELRDQLMTLLMAGHETTATGLAWAFDLLFRAPEKLDRLRDEIMGGGGNGYLDAVIKETLRIRPVVPFVGRQLREAAELGGYHLPAGTVVMPAIYLTHTRPDVYPRPYEFRPERFLDEGPDTFGWIPFGGGTRRCIGAAFAELEMRVVLSTILRRATLRPASDSAERMVRRNVTLSPRGGTPAILVDRK